MAEGKKKDKAQAPFAPENPLSPLSTPRGLRLCGFGIERSSPFRSETLSQVLGFYCKWLVTLSSSRRELLSVRGVHEQQDPLASDSLLPSFGEDGDDLQQGKHMKQNDNGNNINININFKCNGDDHVDSKNENKEKDGKSKEEHKEDKDDKREEKKGKDMDDKSKEKDETRVFP
ncbi:prostatic spermine-binding protein-like [Selaginella moellendorffii]|uniref:prostatic spermine-binding protein-like n=1 Tax=Selaginella moellendorffii TaxID=88036 RepID=UPI000D1C39C6|nr:prostatic spermine-binding protein-like [Selaginella moellendorffii]|eukprot:XP_024522229.1 prostatic spermine-binding protein-like [Selaginella moellendorffii]